MIEYDGRHWLSIIFRLRGSVLPRLLLRIGLVTVIAVIASWAFAHKGTRVPSLAHSLIGVALGLLLVFRTNASYDRYWEGRKLLGAMVNRTRDMARQIAVFIEPEDARAVLLRWTVGFYRLAALTLRRERDLTPLGELLTANERAALAPLAHRAPVLLRWITSRIVEEAKSGRLSEQRLLAMDTNLTALNDALGGAERIVKTPIPFAYAQHIKTFVLVFCTTAPFAMVEVMHWYTPLAAGLLAFALFGIDEIGVEIEDPFGHDANDLPLDAIGDGIAAAAREIVASAPP